MRCAVAVLVLGLAGCSLCRAPKPTACPAGVDCAAFIDPQQECLTIDPVVGQVILRALELTLAVMRVN